MKVLNKILPFAITTILITGCGSTAVKANHEEYTKEPVIHEADDTITVTEPEEPSDEEIFLFGLKDVEIKFTAVPKITNSGKAFSSAFTFIVNKDGVPASDYAATISYPSSKNGDEITYSTVDIVTDENGSYSFKAEVPSFAANTKITVYPTPINSSKEVLEAAMTHKAQADWKVRSNIISKGAVLFIWDFNEKNRPINNSYDILSEFRTRGMTMVGNAPVNETSYIGKPLSTLYKENYEIIEDAYGYLIVGTIKFTKPVEPCDNGYLCSLIADIQAVNMKNGKKIFESTFTHEATGANWNKCVTKCKEELAEEIVDALVYGL